MSYKALVTGGSGFIGSHLTRALVAAGHEVRVLDDLSSGRRSNLAGIEDQIEFLEADLSQRDVAQAACAGVEVVFHQGAIPAVPRSVEDPLGTFRVNVNGTYELLVAARDAGVRRFVLASSSSVYGPTESLPKVETQHPNPVSPYAAQKLSGEQLAMSFFHSFGLETVALRYFNVFGPRQDPTSGYAAVIPAFAAALLAGRPGRINGDGSYSRDFSYIDDVVAANLAAATAPKAPGNWINIAGGKRITILELYETIARVLGVTDLPPELGPLRVGDIPHSMADVTRARELLGWSAKASLEESIAKTVESYRAEFAQG